MDSHNPVPHSAWVSNTIVIVQHSPLQQTHSSLIIATSPAPQCGTMVEQLMDWWRIIVTSGRGEVEVIRAVVIVRIAGHRI